MSWRLTRIRHVGRLAVTALFALVPCLCAATDAPDTCIVGDGAIGCASERSVVELTTSRKDASALRDTVQQKLASGECRRFAYGERVSLVTANDKDHDAIRRPGDRTVYWMPATWARPSAECEPNTSAATLRKKLGLSEPSNEHADDADLDQAFVDNRDPAYRRWRDDETRGQRVERDDDERPPRRYRPFADDRSAGYDDAYADDAYRPRRNQRDDGIYRSHPDRPYRDEDDRRPYAGRYDDDRYTARNGRPPARGPGPALPSSRYVHDCEYRPVMSDADLAACRALRR